MDALGRWLHGFGAFWWDFVVGDDWRIAAGVIVAMAVTAGWPASHCRRGGSCRWPCSVCSGRP
jgi:hypothetical protein